MYKFGSQPRQFNLMHTVLEAIATANPPYKLTQSEAADFMLKTESLSTSIKNRIPSIYANS